MGVIEARTAKRLPAGNRVALVIQGRVILTAIAVNISMGGLYLNAAGAVPVGSPCEVAIYPPDGNETERILAQGRVVRVGEDGMAIQFAKALGDRTLGVLVNPPSLLTGASWLQSYVNYFKVSQSNVSSDCERVFGITRSTFRTISTVSFIACIPTSILPVWIFRAQIPAIPDWAKIALSFGYGALWLLVLQPFIDLSVIRVIRAKASRSSQTP